MLFPGKGRTCYLGMQGTYRLPTLPRKLVTSIITENQRAHWPDRSSVGCRSPGGARIVMKLPVVSQFHPTDRGTCLTGPSNQHL